MAYPIEILTISQDLVKSVKVASDSLNKVQSEFKFEIASEKLRGKMFSHKRDKYKSEDAFQWLTEYKNEVKGHRPFIILVVDGFLSSERWSNIFGTFSAANGFAVFTTNDFDQFVQDKVRFCRYYLVRYAISFLEPSLKSHTNLESKNCIFHFKQNKHEIKISLDSGHICDNCRNILQPKLTNDIDEAITKMLLVVSNQHPFAIILKGGGVKGLAFAGALLELEEHFSFNAFAGTSAGAIAAVLLGAGYKPTELLNELSNKDFNDFKDASFFKSIVNFISKEGFYPGDNIETWINQLLKVKINNKLNEIQLCDLLTHTTVYASRIKDGTLVFDSQGERKETHAAFAARCSMSIPYFFSPKQVDGVRVYDGGMRNNFPLKRFVEDNNQNPFIGLYIKSGTKKGGWVLGELLNVAIDGEEFEIVDANLDKVVVIDTDPIATTDFNLDEDKKNFLVLAGRVGALEYITTYHVDIDIDKTILSNLKNELEEFRAKIKAN
jgi:predicted acylesterase/phospholipase RssA